MDHLATLEILQLCHQLCNPRLACQTEPRTIPACSGDTVKGKEAFPALWPSLFFKGAGMDLLSMGRGGSGSADELEPRNGNNQTNSEDPSLKIVLPRVAGKTSLAK